MTLTISVLCPVWNNARYVAEALASARAQSRKALEIIVVDDGSTDDSASVAESVPGARVLREPHRGVASARNTLVAHARGDLVAFLDSDDRWHPDKIATQAAYMEAHPEVGITYTHQRLILEPGVARPSWIPPGADDAVTPIVATCSMMARRALFTTIGGFDASYEANEDTDWLVRAVSAGVKHATLPEALLLRRVHADNLTHRSLPWSKEVFVHLRASIRRHRRRSDPDEADSGEEGLER